MNENEKQGYRKIRHYALFAAEPEDAKGDFWWYPICYSPTDRTDVYVVEEVYTPKERQ